MNKLLLTLGTVLSISGCSKDPNIDFNCVAGEGDYNFLFTIDTSKKEFIFYEEFERLASYTNYGDKLISEKIFVNWEARLEEQKKYDNKLLEGKFKEKINNGFDEYYVMTFNKINGELVESDFTEKEQINKYTNTVSKKLIETTTTHSCSVIKRVME